MIFRFLAALFRLPDAALVQSWQQLGSFGPLCGHEKIANNENLMFVSLLCDTWGVLGTRWECAGDTLGVCWECTGRVLGRH